MGGGRYGYGGWSWVSVLYALLDCLSVCLFVCVYLIPARLVVYSSRMT